MNIWQKAVEAVIAPAIGAVILIPACYTHAWVETQSTEGPYPVHTIDKWSWDWLNAWYANPEDGVSGRYAMVWVNGVRVHYMADCKYPAWRAYCWNMRNTADQLKYTWGASNEG